MSQQPISLSPDLAKLRAEGYNIEVRGAYLLVHDVPYVTAKREIKRGTLVTDLTLNANVANKPGDHTIYFAGEYPCNADGSPIEKIRSGSDRKELDRGLLVDHRFSAKPKPADTYDDYYHKVMTYVDILSGQARAIDPNVTARTEQVIEAAEDDSVFNYIDTASSRAEITVVTRKLELNKIAIVGLGGTGSYVLDLIAKTPVREIHVFDTDAFSQHNAFRSPGAPSLDELKARPTKVQHFAAIYSKMHRGIKTHDIKIGEATVDQLDAMQFVFLCLDKGAAKKIIVQRLEDKGIPFVDVGMGVNLRDTSLFGMLRVTTSTKERRESRNRIPFADGADNNEYDRNIQIADLNALNAALAVIKWKKLFAFYVDQEREHNTTYMLGGNALINEDKI